MLRGAFESAGEQTPEQLHEAYTDRLRETVTAVGTKQVGEQSGIETETLQALVGGESPTLTLEEALAILATDPELPDQESLQAEARDLLLMGMSMAVLDVEAVAAGIEDEMEPKEIQQKVEGRAPITLAEYATLHQFIEGEKR